MKLRELFGVDPRALGALRIALGLLLVVDLTARLPQVGVFYGDEGLYPRDLVPPASAISCPLPLHMLSGSDAFQTGVCLAAIACALALLVGWRSRLAAFLSWVNLLSMEWRNPHVLQGGEVLLSLLLFWCLFLPIGARYSLDARRRGTGVPSGRLLTFATAGLLLQPAWLYLFAGIHKALGETWRDGTAIQYVLSQTLWERPLAVWAREQSELMALATLATLVFEIAGPFFLFSPWRTQAWRGATIVGLLVLQLGFVLCIELWLFPFISTASLLPFLGPRVWDRIDARLGRPRAGEPGATGERAAWPRGPLAWPARLVSLGALVYVPVSNVDSVVGWDVPKPVFRVGHALGLTQYWALYGPDPRTYEFRWVFRGRTADGRTLVLDDGGRRARLPALDALRSTYRGNRYLETVAGWREREQAAHFGLARWLCRTWNASHAPADDLVEVELVLVETTIELGRREPETRRSSVRRQSCSADLKPHYRTE